MAIVKKIIFSLSFLLLFMSSPCFSAEYYIGSHGDYATWAAFKAAHSTPSTGDDVYFECDETFTPSASISINWDGVDVNNYAVIGAYYYDGSRHIGVSGNKPIISGSNWTVPANSYYGSYNSWGGLIQVTAHDWVYITNLHIYRSGWYGILLKGINGGNYTTDRPQNNVVDNCKVESTYHGSISVDQTYNGYNTIHDNEASYSCRVKYVNPGNDCTAAISTQASQYAYTTYYNNYIHHTRMEGLGASYNSSATIIPNCGYVDAYNNLMWNCRNSGIYVGAAQYANIYNNVIIGASNTDAADYVENGGFGYSRLGRFWNNVGIGVQLEDWQPQPQPDVSIHVYNNFIAGTYLGVWFGSADSTQSYNDVVFYHNTLVDNRRNWYFPNSASYYTTSNSAMKNNISFCFSGSDCTDTGGTGFATALGTKFDWDHNGWTVAPAYIGDATDVEFGTSSPFISAASSVDFQNITEEQIQGLWQLMRLNGSKGVDAGIFLMGYLTDYEGNLWGSPPDMGFLVYNETPQNTPPTALITSPEGDQSGVEDSSWVFTGTCTDPDGDDVSATWNFDGGATNDSCASASSPLSCSANSGSAVTFATEGSYTVTFTCTDDKGASSNQTVDIEIGSPSVTGAIYDWNLEADLTDDGSENQSLTDEAAITYAGSGEPNPPGYGSDGAIFDGSTDYLTLANATTGNKACNGTDTDCTIYVWFNMDANTSTDYLYADYEASSGLRSHAIAVMSGAPAAFWGYNSGDSFQALDLSNTVTAGNDCLIAWAVDTSAKTYTLYFFDYDTQAEYYKTEVDETPLGTFNHSTADITIGARSDAAAFFDGTIWKVSVYDEKHTLSEIQAVKNNTVAGNITRVFAGENGSYKTDDTFHIYANSTAALTVDKSGGTPYIEGETGGTDIQCPLQTANGSGIYQLDFLCTVVAGMATSDLALTANEIQENSGSITGGSLDCPDSGPGSLQYESDVAIDTSAPGGWSTLNLCDADGNDLTADKLYHTNKYIYFKLCSDGDSIWFNDGPVDAITLTFSPTTGSDIVARYYGGASGFGIGNSCWIFRGRIGTDMVETSMLTGATFALNSTGIINASGQDMTDATTMPQSDADPTYRATVLGTPHTYVGE